MWTKFRFLILAFAFISAALSAFSGSLFPASAQHEAPEKAAMVVTDAYSFAVPDGAKTAAAFMTLTYDTGADIVPDRILRAESPAAGKVELHTTVIENDVMSMRPVESFPLPPTGEFRLKPQGVHIMLMDLTGSLKVGESFPLTLVFEKAGAVAVEVDVRTPGDAPMAEEKPHDAHHDHDHGDDHSGHSH